MREFTDSKFYELMRGAQFMDVNGWRHNLYIVENQRWIRCPKKFYTDFDGLNDNSWDQVARLYWDTRDDTYYMMVQEVFRGMAYGNKEPKYYRLAVTSLD